MLRKIKLQANKLVHRRKLRIRVKLKKNNTSELPRLSVHRSNNHVYAQVIDDSKGVTLAYVSTVGKSVNFGSKKKKCTAESAKAIGENIAKKALTAGVKQVVFDKGSRPYGGKIIKTLAEAARESGLKF